VPSHLMDRRLFDFAAVRATGRAEPEGDIAFDVDGGLERAVDAATSVADVAVASPRIAVHRR
jgi:tRNA 2-thiocytidine biosynthesis protein TtcA